ncbi:MAG TPA: GTP-sensing pleiotropic transcriptional regulator CodY [Firmicutes bacterium]|nr:GTP-sensing pleiotropic transcriptional regulator CodY [Bacillota bacterium]
MAASLLEKTRQLNKLLQGAAGRSVNYDEMTQVLSSLINCNVYLADKEGKILGHCLLDEFECDVLVGEVLSLNRFPRDYNNRLLEINETLPNVKQEGRKCVFNRDESCIFEGKVTTIVPVVGAGERLGTLLLARYSGVFGDDDLLLAEYGATVVAMEMLRAKAERMEEEARKKAAVQVAIGTLSYSELEAVQHIFNELNGSEGFLVASKIAEKVGITRSVIVNALRKFESAGVIESRSLGMKGTYIRVLNDRLIEELKKAR